MYTIFWSDGYNTIGKIEFSLVVLFITHTHTHTHTLTTHQPHPPQLLPHIMTSSNGNIFRVTGPLCGEFTGTSEFPSQRPVTRSFVVFFDLHLEWVNNGEAGDLRRHRAHYDVIVMISKGQWVGLCRLSHRRWPQFCCAVFCCDNIISLDCPDSKVHGANMGPIWGRKDPGGPHVVPMNFAIWVDWHSP